MDAVLGFLNNNLVLTATTVLFGLWGTYHPASAKLPRAWITYINAIVVFLVKAMGPAEAEAATVAVLGIPVGQIGSGIAGIVVSSLWTAAQSWLIYRGFLKGPLEDLAHLKPIPTPGHTR